MTASNQTKPSFKKNAIAIFGGRRFLVNDLVTLIATLPEVAMPEGIRVIPGKQRMLNDVPVLSAFFIEDDGKEPENVYIEIAGPRSRVAGTPVKIITKDMILSYTFTGDALNRGYIETPMMPIPPAYDPLRSYAVGDEFSYRIDPNRPNAMAYITPLARTLAVGDVVDIGGERIVFCTVQGSTNLVVFLSGAISGWCKVNGCTDNYELINRAVEDFKRSQE